jgi:phospholipid-transporting ATPase
MSSDFERLVGSSNPAYQAHQRVGGYPPRQSLDNSNPFLIDDGEDYDDTPTTDSRFRQPPPAGSGSTSTYAYGQPPAGYGAQGAERDLLSDDPFDLSQSLGRGASTRSKKSTNTYGTGQPQGWTFDQDDQAANGPSTTAHGAGGVLPFAGSKAFNGLGSHSTVEPRGADPPRRGSGSGTLGGFWKGRFPWQKETVLTGERIVFLNDSRGNDEQGFINNYVSTTKYSLATFMPKFLVGELPLS